MTTTRDLRRLAALGLLAWAAPGLTASGQVMERDVRVTGPRGNSLERDVRLQRNGSFVDRQVTIRRPDGTFRSNTEFYAPPGGRATPLGGARSFGYPGGPRFVERGVVVGGPGPFVGPIVGVPFFSLFLGGGGGGGGGFGGGPPVPPPPGYPAPPPPAPPDAVVQTIAKLGAFHGHDRRGAAISLGTYKDPRAVAPLIDRLQNDHDKEVRMAAAWALAEIGDPRAIAPLETARQFDKKTDVRAVAEKSLGRMPREVVVSPGELPPDTRLGPTSVPARPPTGGQATAPIESTPAPRGNPEDVPPPDPTPAPRASRPVNRGPQ